MEQTFGGYFYMEPHTAQRNTHCQIVIGKCIFTIVKVLKYQSQQKQFHSIVVFNLCTCKSFQIVNQPETTVMEAVDRW